MHRKAKKLSTKFKRSVRAISPVIATLLMIAIAVVASLVAYAWVMGYIGGTTTKAGKMIELPSVASQQGTHNLIVYVQNVGQGSVQLKQDGAVFVNDVLKNILQSPSGTTLTTGQLITIAVGQTVELVIDCPYALNQRIKIVTIDGISMETIGKGTDIPGSGLTYTISVGWSGSGSVIPGGPLVSVNQGATQTFTIAPGDGYHIQDVIVDGLSVGVRVSYTFNNVNQNHFIYAIFQPNTLNTWTITVFAGANGNVNPPGPQVNVQNGQSQTFSFSPEPGYHIASIVADGAIQSITPSYTFSSVTTNHWIGVSFEANTGGTQTPHTITATTNTGGSITPSGLVIVNYGVEQSFQITPNSGYHIGDLQVDGISVGALTSYTFPAVTTDHTIHAVFQSDIIINPPGGPYTITATAGPHGSITPNGVVSVQSGDSQTFTITPESGYQVADVLVDSSSVGATTSYTFPEVTSPHIIFATFALQPSGNVAPSAEFSYSATYLVVQFTDESTDSDGSISSPRAWVFGDGGTSELQNPSHTYASGGTYNVRLTVTDNDGATDYKEYPITVSADNVAPSAEFSYSATYLVVQFTDESTDSDGSISSPRAWVFGDGGTSELQNPSHTYASGGTYNVRLTVTDNDGATDYKEYPITVSAPTASLHHFTITEYPTTATTNQGFSVRVTAYDADNNILTTYAGQVYFTWTAVTGGGTAILPFTQSNPYQFVSTDGGSQLFSGFEFSAAGTKTITVTTGTISQTSEQITVLPNAEPHYTASIIPPSAPTNTIQSFTLTVTRQSSNYRNLGWVSIQVPTGFTSISVTSVSGSNGKTWVADTVSGNIITIHAQNTENELTYRDSNPHVDVIFSAATPLIPDTYGPFVSTAYEHFDKSGSGPGTLNGNDPSVIIFNDGVLDHFEITGSYPTSVTAGQNFGNIIVTAYDGGNNRLTTYTGQVYFTSTDPASTLPFTSSDRYSFTSGDSGQKIFSGFTLTKIGSQTITVTDGSESAQTSTITVTAGSLHHFTITGEPSSTTSGVSFGEIIVRAYDAYNNLATPFRGRVYFQSTDGSATLPYTQTGSTYQFTSTDAGVHTFSGFTLRTAGQRTITVYYLTDNSISATTTPITVTAPLHHFTITECPTTVTVNQGFGGAKVTAYDLGNNVLTGYNGQIYFAWTAVTGGGSATLPYTSTSRYTFVSGDAGIHIFSGFEFSATGSKTISATDGSISSTPYAITVIAAGSLHYSTSMTPISSLPSTSVSYTYTVTKVSGTTYPLGNVKIQIPTGFASISVTSVAASNGQTWVKSLNGNFITVNAQDDAGELTASGQTITVVFMATAPSATGTYGPLVSTAYEDYRGSTSGAPGQLDGNDPSISVYRANTVLIQTGWEGNPWDQYWQEGGNPPFYPGVGEGIGGTTAAKSDQFGSNSGPFTSDDMYTLDASIIQITFSYKVQGTSDPTDLRLAYSTQANQPPNLDPYPNPNFIYFEDGRIGQPLQDDVWYTVTITIAKTATTGAIVDAGAFANHFYFRFESTLSTNPISGMQETVWIDDVSITKSP